MMGFSRKGNTTSLGCSRKASASRSAAFIALAILTCYLSTAIGCGQRSGRPPSMPPGPPANSDLEVIDTKWDVVDETAMVTGTVVNHASRPYFAVQINIDIVDKQGQKIGFVLATVNNLQPGAQQVFRTAAGKRQEGMAFKIRSVTGN